MVILTTMLLVVFGLILLAGVLVPLWYRGPE